MSRALPKPKYPAARIGMPGEQAYTASEVRALLADRDRLAAALQASPVAPASEGEGRAQFERWLTEEYFGGLEGAGDWDEKRNCYVRLDTHMAYCGWRAARTASLGRVG